MDPKRLFHAGNFIVNRSQHFKTPGELISARLSFTLGVLEAFYKIMLHYKFNHGPAEKLPEAAGDPQRMAEII